MHHSLLTQGQIWEIFAKIFWELAILKNELFLSRPFWIFFCFIPMKISPNLYGRMDGLKFWCFPWFPENSLLCVILRYTVYMQKTNKQKCNFCQLLWCINLHSLIQIVSILTHLTIIQCSSIPSRKMAIR